MQRISKHNSLLDIILAGLVILIFFQLLTDFVAGIYAFGLLGSGIPVEIAAVLLFLSPVVILIGGKALRGKALVVAGELALLCRVIEPLLDTRTRMLISGLGVAILLIFLVSLVWNKGAGLVNRSGLALPAGLALAVGLSIALRSLNSSVDLSLDGASLWVGWVLAAAAALLLAVALPVPQPAPEEIPGRTAGRARIVGLCLGLIGVLVMFYLAFTSPGVVARWTGEDHLLILVLASGSLALFSLLLVLKSTWFSRIFPLVLLAWNLAFLIALMLTILPYQLLFPLDAAGYPFYEPAVNSLAVIPLIVTLLLYPVLILDFLLIWRTLTGAGASARLLGGGFTVAAVYMLLMIFAHVFTTTYDYFPVIGPVFRDQFWLVYLVAGLVPAMSVLLTGQAKTTTETEATQWQAPSAFAWGMVALAGLAIVGAALTAATPPDEAVSSGPLKVMTYNIRQGYSDAGLKNYDGQLEVIRQFSPDILGLQESDTNRIANGNSDIVRYFADQLDMYTYFGPKTVTGTFGIALLSRFPIENPRTFYMYSEGEQTAAIEAQILVGGKTYTIIVTHLGNGGPLVQQQALLQAVGEAENVIAMGDYNFRPDTEQYALTIGTWQDAWLLKWPTGIDDQGNNPDRRIDHVFVSLGMVVEDIRYLNSPASDHPAVLASIR